MVIKSIYCVYLNSVIIIIIIWDEDLMFLQKSSEMFTDQVTDIKERNHHYKHAGQPERDLQKYDQIK